METTVTEVWQHIHDGLRGFIAKRVANEAEVDDILQEVFLRMHQRIKTLKNPRRVVSWVYQITRHVIIDHYRAPERRRARLVGLAPDMEATGTVGLERNASEPGEPRVELAGCLQPMLAQLGKEYREAIRLVELEGLTHQEAAKRLGLSVSGMKSRVQRGRQQLKCMLNDCCLIQLNPRKGIADYTMRDPKRSPC